MVYRNMYNLETWVYRKMYNLETWVYRNMYNLETWMYRNMYNFRNMGEPKYVQFRNMGVPNYVQFQKHECTEICTSQKHECIKICTTLETYGCSEKGNILETRVYRTMCYFRNICIPKYVQSSSRHVRLRELHIKLSSEFIKTCRITRITHKAVLRVYQNMQDYKNYT